MCISCVCDVYMCCVLYCLVCVLCALFVYCGVLSVECVCCVSADGVVYVCACVVCLYPYVSICSGMYVMHLSNNVHTFV